MSHASTRNNAPVTRRSSGWVAFAGYLMIVAGVFHAIAGLVALFKPSLYLATDNHLFVFNYTGWGWVHIAIGILLALSAFSLFAGRLWGRIVAIFFATISALLNFGFIWAYPLWSIMIIIVDVIIIYSVAMYGGEPQEY